MTRWQFDAETRWWGIKPSAATVRKAERRFRPDLTRYFDRAGAHGFIGEAAFEHWLRSCRIPFVHDGGVNRSADFTIRGHGVEVKTRSLKARKLKGDYLVNVPDEQANNRADVYVFAVWHIPAAVLYLVGAITRPEFLRRSGRAAMPWTDDGGHPAASLAIEGLYPLELVKRLHPVANGS